MTSEKKEISIRLGNDNRDFEISGHPTSGCRVTISPLFGMHSKEYVEQIAKALLYMCKGTPKLTEPIKYQVQIKSVASKYERWIVANTDVSYLTMKEERNVWKNKRREVRLVKITEEVVE